MKKILLAILISTNPVIYAMQPIPPQALQAATYIGKNVMPKFQGQYQTEIDSTPNFNINKKSMYQMLQELQKDTQKLKADQQAYMNPKVFSKYYTPHAGSHGLLKPTHISFQSKQKTSIPEPRSMNDAKKILGISSANPTNKEIKIAFNQKAMEAHPDTGGNHQNFLNVQKARDILLGKEKPESSTTQTYNHNYQPQSSLEKQLHEAIGNKDIKAVQNLIEKGANVNNKENSSETPLMFAAKIPKNTAIISLLISKGADVNAQDYGQTALILATMELDNLDNISCLLQHGADIKIKDSQGYDALAWAAYNTSEIFKLLINYAKINTKTASSILQNIFIITTNQGFSPGYWNGKANIFENINFLINFGIDVHEKIKFGVTLLMSASYVREYNEIIKELIIRGSDVNAKDDEGKTALMIAAQFSSSVDINNVLTLLTYGANVNAQDNEGKTPLMYAAMQRSNIEHGNLNLIKTLIAHGANINTEDNNGKTALFYAEKHHNTNTASYLRTLNESLNILSLKKQAIPNEVKNKAEKTKESYFDTLKTKLESWV